MHRSRVRLPHLDIIQSHSPSASRWLVVAIIIITELPDSRESFASSPTSAPTVSFQLTADPLLYLPKYCSPVARFFTADLSPPPNHHSIRRASNSKPLLQSGRSSCRQPVSPDFGIHKGTLKVVKLSASTWPISKAVRSSRSSTRISSSMSATT